LSIVAALRGHGLSFRMVRKVGLTRRSEGAKERSCEGAKLRNCEGGMGLVKSFVSDLIQALTGDCGTGISSFDLGSAISSKTL